LSFELRRVRLNARSLKSERELNIFSSVASERCCGNVMPQVLAAKRPCMADKVVATRACLVLHNVVHCVCCGAVILHACCAASTVSNDAFNTLERTAVCTDQCITV